MKKPTTSSELSKAWRATHPEYNASAVTKAWKAAHPGHSKAWFKAHPGYIVKAGKLHRDRLHKRLTGRKRPKTCDVCRRRDQPIHYDHCHKSGLFRGWLCRDCNAVLGYVRDSITVLRKLIEYLERFRSQPRIGDERAAAQKAYAKKLELYKTNQAARRLKGARAK